MVNYIKYSLTDSRGASPLKEKLSALHALQQLDSAIDSIKRELANLNPGRAERTLYEQAKQVFAEIETKVHSLQTSILDQELEQKSIAAKHAEEEKKLYSGTVRNPKEMTAMQEELEMFKRQLARLYDKMVGLIDTLEAERIHEANAKAALKTATRALKTKQDQYKARAEELGNQGRALTVQRKEAAAEVEPSLLALYERLRGSMGGIAVSAIIEGGSCEGCRMKLPTGILVAVNLQRELVYCDNCHRLLVMAKG